MSDTAIEWTDKTWNPTVGCTRVSPGCKHCYAFKLHDMRHKAFLEGKNLPAQYGKPFTELQMMEDRLTDPLHWRKPCRIFVNSVSDLFHKDVPDEFICQVFKVMGQAARHTFQVLTKRADRMQRFMREQTNTHAVRMLGDPGFHVEWPYPNVWLGVSVEDQKRTDRIELLRQTPAAVRFLSCEPLLGDLGELNLTGIHWVIVGGESGGTPAIRPMHRDWVYAIRDQCQAAKVAFFFKQWGDWVGGEDFYSGTDDTADGGRPAGLYADLENGEALHDSEVKHGDWHSWLGEDEHETPNDPVSVRVGKKSAGRLLEGREWNDFPPVREVV